MRIVSLLPSATEIVYKLGLDDQLCGVSFDCDYPEAVRSVPVVSGSALPTDGASSTREIDAAVRDRVAAGESIYTLDDELIRSINPDLILAQDLCRVCAVPSGDVEDALRVIGCRAQVVSLDPSRLDDVIQCIGTVGEVTGTEARAEMHMADLRRRVEVVRHRVSGLDRPRVLVLEWPDPPFNAGHWVPDMVEAAGGSPVLAPAGIPSRRLTWEEIAGEPADITIFAPCGYDLEGAIAQAPALLDRPEVDDLGWLYAVDASSYFSRPGPRVVDGVELLAEVLHPTRPLERDVPGARMVRRRTT